MRVWDTRHGLPHNSINHISQDQQGYLWIATWQGPVRFNGSKFEVFNDENDNSSNIDMKTKYVRGWLSWEDNLDSKNII